MVSRRKLVTLHYHIMKPPKDASLPLNVCIFRSTQRLISAKFDYCLQGCDVCLVQFLTIRTRNFHIHLEVGASRVLRNVGDYHITMCHISKACTASYKIKNKAFLSSNVSKLYIWLTRHIIVYYIIPQNTSHCWEAKSCSAIKTTYFGSPFL